MVEDLLLLKVDLILKGNQSLGRLRMLTPLPIPGDIQRTIDPEWRKELQSGKLGGVVEKVGG